MAEPKYILFKELPASGKTKFWEIRTSDGACRLGEIKWFTKWRCYCFFPQAGVSIFDTQCLKDIVAFIEKQMLQRKLEKQT